MERLSLSMLFAPDGPFEGRRVPQRAGRISPPAMRSLLLARNPSLTAATLDDIYWGCVQQTLERRLQRIARNAALLAEIPPFGTHRRSPSAYKPVWFLDAGVTRCSTGDHDRRCAGLSGLAAWSIWGTMPMSHGGFSPGSGEVATSPKRQDDGVTAEMLSACTALAECRTSSPRVLTLAPRPTPSLAFKTEIIPTGGHDANGVLKQFNYDEVIAGNLYRSKRYQHCVGI